MNRKVFFDFHGLAHLVLHPLTPALMEAVTNIFQGFQTDLSSCADVEVLPLKPEQFPEITPQRYKNKGRSYFDLTRHMQPLIVSTYRGDLDVVVMPGETVKVYVADRERAGDKLTDFVQLALIIALNKKHATLCHGAVLRKDETPVVLIGVSGAGKTSLLLHMLADRWEYLSDNCFLAHGGTVYDFRSRIVFHTYHTLAFPELFKQAETDLLNPTRIKSQSWLRKIGTRHIPHYLHGVGQLSKVIDPYLSRQPKQLFPQIQTFRQTKPRAIIVLLQGSQMDFRPIPTQIGIRRFELINQMAWSQFDEVNRLMEANTGHPLYNFGKNLAASFTDNPFYQLIVPPNVSLPELYAFLEQNIKNLAPQSNPSNGGTP